MGGGRNPPIKRWDGDAEIAGRIAGRDAAGKKLLGRFDLAFGHLSFASPFAAKLASDFETHAGAFDGEFPFHFGKTGHPMKEEASRGGAGVDRVGEALA